MTTERISGWVGWIWFAAVMMVVDGVFNIIHGLTAIFNDQIFVDVRGWTLLFDLTGWGWIHVIIGILLIVVGIALGTGSGWARIVGVILVSINAIAQMMSIPFYPWWSLLAIVLDGFILYALIVHGEEAQKVRL